MKARAALLLLAVSSVLVVAPANAAGTLSVTGPTMTALRVDGTHVNPRLGTSVPVTYSFTSTAWTTVVVEVRDAAGNVVRTLDTKQAPSGTFATSWDGKDAEGDAVADGAYAIVATPAGYVYDDTIGDTGVEPSQLRLPLGAAEAPDGTVWVADVDRVVHYGADGTYLSSFPFSRPVSIRFINDGTFFVSNGTNSAVRYGADGTELSRLTLTSPSSIYDAQQLSNGNMIAGGGYYPYAPSNLCCAYQTMHRWLSATTSYTNNGGLPANYAVMGESAGGYIYSVGGGDSAIHAYYSYGPNIWNNGTLCIPGCQGIGQMYGTARGEGGGPIVTMYTRHQVGEFPEFSATPLWMLGYNGTNHGQLEYPYSITRSGSLLYIADQYNNRIEVYRRSSPMSASVIVDTRGPDVSTFDLSRSVDGGAIFSAVASDANAGSSPIAGVELFIDGTADDGSGQQLFAKDGAFDEPIEAVFGYLSPGAGVKRLYVHARDAGANWGGYQTLDAIITGTPASLTLQAARATVAPLALDGDQVLRATLRDEFGNALPELSVGFTLCSSTFGPLVGPQVCSSGAGDTDADGVARWTVPAGSLLLPGTYIAGASVAGLNATTSFAVGAGI